MGFEFEGRWRAEVERRARRSVIAPRDAEQLNTPEAVQDYIEYIHGFEAKHAVLWKWILIWTLYPFIVVLLMAIDLLTVFQQQDSYPQALFGFLVGGCLFFAAKDLSKT